NDEIPGSHQKPGQICEGAADRSQAGHGDQRCGEQGDPVQFKVDGPLNLFFSLFLSLGHRSHLSGQSLRSHYNMETGTISQLKGQICPKQKEAEPPEKLRDPTVFPWGLGCGRNGGLYGREGTSLTRLPG